MRATCTYKDRRFATCAARVCIWEGWPTLWMVSYAVRCTGSEMSCAFSVGSEAGILAHGGKLMDYLALKAVHVGSAAASLSLFITRGIWMMWTPERLQRGWVKIVPHVVDTVLLASAIGLVWQLGGFAALRTQPWLVAKIVALLAYIVLGSIALKRGRTMRTRVVAFIVAVAVFGYIVAVAVAKSPFGFLSGL